MTRRVYLSAHLDDAVFSCGGLIGRQSAAGDDVEVVTVFTGDPPVGELTPFAYELHRRWGGEGSPMGLRRAEDLVACGRLGAPVIHLGFADAIYRRSSRGQPLHPDAEAIFSTPADEDLAQIEAVVEALERSVAREAEVYLPLAIGGHVDHVIVRRAGARLERARWYYRDVPYVLQPSPRIVEPAPSGVAEARLTLAETEIDLWATAAGEYHSQITSFWPDLESLDADLRAYHDRGGGLVLLRRTGEPSPARLGS